MSFASFGGSDADEMLRQAGGQRASISHVLLQV